MLLSLSRDFIVGNRILFKRHLLKKYISSVTTRRRQVAMSASRCIEAYSLERCEEWIVSVRTLNVIPFASFLIVIGQLIFRLSSPGPMPASASSSRSQPALEVMALTEFPCRGALGSVVVDSASSA